MMKHVIKKDTDLTFDIEDDNSKYIVAKGVALTGPIGMTNYDHDNVTIVVEGLVTGGQFAMLSDGYFQGLEPEGVALEVGRTGRVIGDMYGVSFSGNGSSVTNDGIIRGGTVTAIDLQGNDLTVVNHGKMLSDTGYAVHLFGNGFHLENHGLLKTNDIYEAVNVITTGDGKLVNGPDGIISGGMDFDGAGGNVTVLNKGRIDPSKADGMAAQFGFGDDSFINKGQVKGTIDMGDGEDSVNVARGKLIGTMVAGGDGNDVFVIGKRQVYIAEYDQGGNDTIKTAKSYVLGDLDSNEIEKLQAMGSGNVDLTGNQLNNTLLGNTGKNVLTGNLGDDFLIGGKGADSLHGGVGDDRFSFFTGDGKDTIFEFHKGDDRILLRFMPGIEEFSDLDGQITLSQDGKDTLINLGEGDQIRLSGFVGTLDASDFQIITDIFIP